jgi:hypothetical protein
MCILVSFTLHLFNAPTHAFSPRKKIPLRLPLDFHPRFTPGGCLTAFLSHSSCVIPVSLLTFNIVGVQ